MKPGALPTIRRLAKLQSDQAGDAVRQTRAARADVEQNLMQLEAYRQNLGPAGQTGQISDGQSLRGRAVFAAVADTALKSARQTRDDLETLLKKKLDGWYQAREKERILGKREDAIARQAEREREKRETASIPNTGANPKT